MTWSSSLHSGLFPSVLGGAVQETMIIHSAKKTDIK
jgi:hypothetical protein